MTIDLSPSKNLHTKKAKCRGEENVTMPLLQSGKPTGRQAKEL